MDSAVPGWRYFGAIIFPEAAQSTNSSQMARWRRNPGLLSCSLIIQRLSDDLRCERLSLNSHFLFGNDDDFVHTLVLPPTGAPGT